MLSTDMGRVLVIQDTCYTDIVPESRQSLEAKLQASPSTCFVACVDNQLVGYLVSVPWRLAAPPELNAPECSLPEVPDCLYLHDLAVFPAARRTGAGQALVNTFMQCLSKLELRHASLIAIQASMAYWQRHGFQPVAPDEALRAKLAGYGKEVTYMEYSMSGLQSV